jgi:hypothetical protein
VNAIADAAPARSTARRDGDGSAGPGPAPSTHPTGTGGMMRTGHARGTQEEPGFQAGAQLSDRDP